MPVIVMALLGANTHIPTVNADSKSAELVVMTISGAASRQTKIKSNLGGTPLR